MSLSWDSCLYLIFFIWQGREKSYNCEMKICYSLNGLSDCCILLSNIIIELSLKGLLFHEQEINVLKLCYDFWVRFYLRFISSTHIEQKNYNHFKKTCNKKVCLRYSFRLKHAIIKDSAHNTTYHDFIRPNNQRRKSSCHLILACQQATKEIGKVYLSPFWDDSQVSIIKNIHKYIQ